MPDISRFAAELNEAQLEAVTYTDGPSLVVAGAGSGKTRVLTYKIAYLLQCGLHPSNILALTFTNKAAREMNARIAQICGNDSSRYLWSGTFHSIFARILRIEHEATGFPANFTIYDTADSRSLIKVIVKELGLDDKTYKPTIVSYHISDAKNKLILPAEYEANPEISALNKACGYGALGKIYSLYQSRLRAATAMDFDDLLLHTYLLLRDHPDVRQRYQQRFQYILVDEYQDTNKVQHHILRLLTSPASRICVVGDDAQSIYGFRGADISNILNFQQQYPTARLIKLECNYRSTGSIVEAANSIIRHNAHQIPKNIYAAGGEGEHLKIFGASSDKDEAQKVAMRIVKLHRHGLDYNDIALLYRTNAQSRSFEETFKAFGIPYRIYGGLSFYQRKEIKDVIAYFRLICNPNDDEAFRRIINYPARGIGATTFNKLQRAAAQSDVSLWQVSCEPQAYDVGLNGGAACKIAAFCQLIASLRSRLNSTRAWDLATAVVKESGMQRELAADNTADDISRRENVDELLGSIKAFEDEVAQEGEPGATARLTDFLATVSLLTDADEQTDDTPRVTLMTIHASKGLEFDAVFVTGMEHDLFPNERASYSAKEMDEERRLFYVAVTRAKHHCYLSYAASRYRFGSLEFNEPSRFLSEIDEQYVDREDSASFTSGSSNGRNGFSRTSQFGSTRYNAAPSYSTPTPRSVRPAAPPSGFKRVSAPRATNVTSSAASATTSYAIGTRIRHERFGLGTIVGTEGTGANEKILVTFDECGTKNLLVKYARFTVC